MPAQTIRVGWKRFRILTEEDRIYLRIWRMCLGIPLPFLSPAEVDLSNYAAIFTDYQFQRSDSGGGYDRFTLRIMKLTWEKTLKFRFSSEQPFSELLDFLSENAPHLKILRGPPSEGWGNDQRPWWRQWS